MRNSTATAERIGRYRRGRLSEWLAAAALLARGYRILGRRVRTPYGEIDLIAVRGRRLAFVEVKRRATRGEAEAAVTLAPGRPHRPRGRVLGEPPPCLSRPRAGPRRGPGHAAAPAGAHPQRPAGDAGAPATLALTLLARMRLQNALGHGGVSSTLRRSRLEDKADAAHRCLPDGPHRPHRHPRRFHLRPAARGAAARPHALLLHAAQSLAAGRAPDRPRLHAAGRGQGRRPLSPVASRAPRISPTSTWCCCARTRRSTCPTSPPRICSERIHPKTLVVNDPAHVRNAPEKVFVLDFLDLMPPTLVTRNLEDVKAFRAEHKDIILKPLYGNGGSSVFRIGRGRHQPQLAGRAVPDRVPRALHGAAIPPRGARRRQAHHPGRRRAGRRRQPRAGGRRDALQPARRRRRHGRPSSPRATARSAPGSGRS